MNAVTIKNLTKRYDVFEIESLSIDIPKGTIMGLIGQNGAGKTTIIKSILGMIRTDGGEITVLGTDNHSEEFTSLKEDIGIVLGEMGIAGCLDGKQIDKIMNNIYKNWDSVLFMNYLRQFDIPSNKEFKSLSKGMKMKMGIAVALSHRAKLLILDEATSGLDPVVRDEILDILMDFTRNEENTVLLSSHIVSDLEKACDYIAFIHKGKLLITEEKDRLREEYAIVHMSKEDFYYTDKSLVKGKKENPYGVDVLMRKNDVPEDAHISPVNIEDLFILMAREA